MDNCEISIVIAVMAHHLEVDSAGANVHPSVYLWNEQLCPDPPGAPCNSALMKRFISIKRSQN